MPRYITRYSTLEGLAFGMIGWCHHQMVDISSGLMHQNTSSYKGNRGIADVLEVELTLANLK